MPKVFSIEDGNLSNTPLVSSVSRIYKDIDLTFTPNTIGEIYKKTDAAAVKQSIKNILLTNRTEKPFKPVYGANLNKFLFNLSSEITEAEIEEEIALAISNYEPRARFLNAEIRLQSDANSILIIVYFQVVATNQNESVTVSLTRLR